jgi:hypothetical protein
LSFFSELRRRNVFRVAATYAIVMWLLIQVVTVVSGPLSLPSWFETVVIVLLVIGFPVALVLAWAFELTPDGIRPTQHQGAIDPGIGRRLDYVFVAALVLVAAISLRGQLSSPVIDDASIAVLPFDDMSPAGDQEYFGDGIGSPWVKVRKGTLPTWDEATRDCV